MRRVIAVNSNPGWVDDDEDGVLDSRDNCDGTYNPAVSSGGGPLLQPDTNDDGIGDRCDCDYNDDGVCATADA